MTNQEAIKILEGLAVPIHAEAAFDMAISALQAQEAKTQLSAEGTTSDLISRQAAINTVKKHYRVDNDLLEVIVYQLENLPSAQPERKTGWWLIREGISDAQCSECKMYFRDVYDMDNSDAFCRHCGTKMEGLKVVEDE